MNALLLFFTALILEILYITLFILTIKMPGFHFWPPPSYRSWQFYLAWLIAGIVVVIVLYLGLLDFDSSFLPNIRLRLPFALFFFLVGTTLGTWASMVFGLRAILGLGDKMITKGPYRYTRNPQYIGDSLNAIGYMLLMNSWMVGVLGTLGILLNILAPLAEEPWLEERFGESYREYKRKVPRFI